MVTKVGVSVIIIDENKRILVGKRKGSHGAGLLAVPGGHLEFGESYNTCCDRELIEEIGINFDGDYKQIGFSEDFFNHDGLLKHYITLYFVTNVDSSKITITNMEPDKCEEWLWVSNEELSDTMFCDTFNQIKKYLASC